MLRAKLYMHQRAVYIEKTFPGNKDDPPSHVRFSEFLKWEQIYPFARANGARTCSHRLKQHLCILWLSRVDRVDSAGRAKVFIWQKVGLETLPL